MVCCTMYILYASFLSLFKPVYRVALIPSFYPSSSQYSLSKKKRFSEAHTLVFDYNNKVTRYRGNIYARSRRRLKIAMFYI